ncbi:hypothetical protein M8J75_007945 [Diaphorina citri]|nr:hypothetical protein M8J75_007945 [Diaphorina citri]
MSHGDEYCICLQGGHGTSRVGGRSVILMSTIDYPSARANPFPHVIEPNRELIDEPQDDGVNSFISVKYYQMYHCAMLQV